MLFLIDEDVSTHLAELLNQRGHDAVTARQLGLAGKGTSDIEQGRVLVTENHRDFLDLHRLSHFLAEAWQVSADPMGPGGLAVPHPGILTVHQLPAGSIHLTDTAISQLVNFLTSLVGELHYWRHDGNWEPFPISARHLP
jgi:hypothetical protein